MPDRVSRTTDRVLGRRELLATTVGAALSLGFLSACAPVPPTAAPAPPVRLPRPVGVSVPQALVTQALIDPDEVAARFVDARPTKWGLDMDGIESSLAQTHDASGQPRLALTFDACGGEVDYALLDGLREHRVHATLFLNQRWIDKYPDLATELASDPLFELANHGSRHLPLSVTGRSAYGISGTVSASDAVDEVWSNQMVLTELCGRAPRHFRSGTAHYDDVAVQIVHALGAVPAGFTVNGDGGATYSASTVCDELVAAPAGSIVIAHMNQPDGGTAAGTLRALPRLVDAGVVFVHLD